MSRQVLNGFNAIILSGELGEDCPVTDQLDFGHDLVSGSISKVPAKVVHTSVVVKSFTSLAGCG